MLSVSICSTKIIITHTCIHKLSSSLNIQNNNIVTIFESTFKQKKKVHLNCQNKSCINVNEKRVLFFSEEIWKLLKNRTSKWRFCMQLDWVQMKIDLVSAKDEKAKDKLRCSLYAFFIQFYESLISAPQFPICCCFQGSKFQYEIMK